MQKYRIEVYVTEEGSEPFSQWLASLRDKTVKTRLYARLKRVEYGNFGDCKRIKGTPGLYELREHYGSGFRVFYSIVGDRAVLLLAGSTKKDQDKTIARARQYLEDYHRRNRS